MALNVKNRTLFTGDNLDVMRGINSDSVDLIYLDPPFNSNRNYEAPIGSEAAGAAFKDAWTLDDVDVAWHGLIAEQEPALASIIESAGLAHGKSMQAYLTMMAVRLLELRRILKPTGSLYMHCDTTANAYLRMLCDAVFGIENFRSEVVWKRHNARSTEKRWPRVHDTILFLSKSNRFRFTSTKVPGDTAKIPHTLITGADGSKYQTYELTGPGVTAAGESGRPWRGYDPTPMGRHWANSHAKMDDWDRAGLIHWPKKKTGSGGGFPRRRASEPFVPEARLVTVGDVWTDIDRINQAAKERVGYPTQKPLALLERIIKASSNEGDVVFDPFCGCATALVAAETLGRQWVGIDLSSLAVNLVLSRLQKAADAGALLESGRLPDVHHRTDIPQRTDVGELPPYKTHRHTLYGKQEGNCAGCGIHFPFRNLTVDHIVPRSRGGTDHLDNLQLLCGACNSMKGTISQAAFHAKLTKQGLR